MGRTGAARIAGMVVAGMVLLASCGSSDGGTSTSASTERPTVVPDIAALSTKLEAGGFSCEDQEPDDTAMFDIEAPETEVSCTTGKQELQASQWATKAAARPSLDVVFALACGLSGADEFAYLDGGRWLGSVSSHGDEQAELEAKALERAAKAAGMEISRHTCTDADRSGANLDLGDDEATTGRPGDG